MRRLALLVGKDLARKARAPLGLLVALSFPIVFAGLIALVFGARGDAVPKVRLVVENRDDGFLSGAVASAFTSKRAAEYFDVRTVETGEGRAVIEAGEASALLVIPERFSSDLLEGSPVTLELVRNPAEGILPEVAEQIATILAQVLDGGARVLRAPLDELRPLLDEGAGAPSDASIAEVSIGFKQTLESAGTFVFPPAIALEGAFGSGKEPASSGDGSGAIFLVVLPGVAVYALFLIGDNAMRDILSESAAGTLRRQLAGPVRASTLVAGKAVFAATLSLVALMVLAAVGALFAPSLPSVPGFVALSLALVLAVVGTGSAIYGFAATERRGATFASIVYLAMGFLGGSFVQIENLPQSLQAAARWTPFYWGTSGYRTLLEKNGGLADVLPNVVVLGAMGIVLLAAGSHFLRRSVRRSGAAA